PATTKQPSGSSPPSRPMEPAGVVPQNGTSGPRCASASAAGTLPTTTPTAAPRQFCAAPTKPERFLDSGSRCLAGGNVSSRCTTPGSPPDGSSPIGPVQPGFAVEVTMDPLEVALRTGILPVT